MTARSSKIQIDLMDPKDRYIVEGLALSTAPEDVEEDIQASENDTNSLQSLSHLDPPADAFYMICGVLIAMVLVGVIIVLLAVTISKLRKRDDHQHHHHHHNENSVHPEQVQVQVAQTTTTTTTMDVFGGIANPAMCSSTDSVDSCSCGNNINGSVVAAQNNANAANNGGAPVIVEKEAQTIFYATAASAEQFIWQFPPPYPPNNTPPPQYALYNDQDTLVHGLQTDRQGFAKGFRKNLGGRWRRLVKKKPESETCAIPPELKDQLKTIYVY